MGNTPTTLNNTNNEDFLNELDTLVANFISQEEFQYYKNLSDVEECNKIFVVSQKLFNQYLDNEKTTTLHKRIKAGNIDFKQDLDIVTDKVKIKRFIQDIATFYTTIANVITTISLSMGLSVKDIYLKSLTKKTLSKEDEELLKDAKTLKKYQEHLQKSKLREDSNIQRLNSVFSVPTMQMTPFYTPTQTPIMFSPNMIDHSVLKQRGGSKIDFLLSPSTHAIKILSNKMEETDFCSKEKDIMNYEAISQLLALFNNKNMDQKTLQFSETDEENDALKQHAIKTLKEAYNKTLNNELLQQYCSSEARLTKDDMRQIKSNEELFKLFQEYGKNLGEISVLEKSAQERLLKIIKLIIIFPSFGNSNYRINPELTHTSLEKLVEKTRNILVKYFIEIESIYAVCVDTYLLLLEKLKLFERKTLSKIQEELYTIQEGGNNCKVNKRNIRKKKNKTKKKSNILKKV